MAGPVEGEKPGDEPRTGRWENAIDDRYPGKEGEKGTTEAGPAMAGSARTRAGSAKTSRKRSEDRGHDRLQGP